MTGIITPLRCNQMENRTRFRERDVMYLECAGMGYQKYLRCNPPSKDNDSEREDAQGTENFSRARRNLMEGRSNQERRERAAPWRGRQVRSTLNFPQIPRPFDASFPSRLTARSSDPGWWARARVGGPGRGRLDKARRAKRVRISLNGCISWGQR